MPRPPARWQAVGVMLAALVLSCGGVAVAHSGDDPPVIHFVPVVVAPGASAGARVAPRPSPGHSARPGASARPTVSPRASVRPGPVAPRLSPSVAQAQAWARAALGSTQYGCLAAIVRHEDGTWDPRRTNPVSGAYGIPQALPGSKMASAGADWRSNRITQVRWTIYDYLVPRYGSACGGWAFWQSHRWY